MASAHCKHTAGTRFAAIITTINITVISRARFMNIELRTFILPRGVTDDFKRFGCNERPKGPRAKLHV